MKAAEIFLFLILVIDGFTPSAGFGQEKIRIGVPLFPAVAFPAFVASEKGFFERNALKVEIIRINSEPTTYQALISGDIDAALGAPAGLVLNNLQGVAVVSLGSWDNSVPYTLATREKIDDLSQPPRHAGGSRPQPDEGCHLASTRRFSGKVGGPHKRGH